MKDVNIVFFAFIFVSLLWMINATRHRIENEGKIQKLEDEVELLIEANKKVVIWK